MAQQFASDYVDVATRVVEFRTKHPGGSLQPADPAHPYRIETIGDTTWIVVVAAAFRAPDDPRPGIGMAYEQFPGKTNFTRNSELQNAETSAWGRAIMAALAADARKGIASTDEIRNRNAEQAEPLDPAKVTRSKGKSADDQWTAPPKDVDPLTVAKREVWAAAVKAGVVIENAEGQREALAKEYTAQMGGELAAATLEELRQFEMQLATALGGAQ